MVDFIWGHFYGRNIDEKDNDILYDTGTYNCTFAPSDKSELFIEPYSQNDVFLNGKVAAYKIVQGIAEKYKKITTFQVKNPKRPSQPFMFQRDKNGNILYIEPSQKNITSSNVAKITKKNEEKNKEATLKVEEEKEKDDKKEYDEIRDREFDEYNEHNVPTFIKNNNITLAKTEEEVIPIKTIDPLLSEDQYKSFMVDKYESIEFNYNKEDNKKDVGNFTYKPNMNGYLLMIQNVISSEEPKSPEDMMDNLIKQLKSISRKMSNKKYEDMNKEFKKLKKELKQNPENKEIQNNFDKIKDFVDNYGYYKYLPYIYIDFLQKWYTGRGSEKVKDSGGFYDLMTSYFPEFISPFVPLYGFKPGNKTCIDEKSIEALNLLKSKILGSSQKPYNELIDKALISYPLGKTTPLYDSVLMFKSGKNKHQCILLSTKGGKTGKGAAASIAGLKSFIYNKESAIPEKLFTDPTSHFDASLYTNAYLPYMVEFARDNPYNNFALKVISCFMLSSPLYYKEIVDSIYDVIYKEKLKIKPDDLQKAKMVQKFLNSDEYIQKCVLSALTYGSYGFAQINCKQYPADKHDFNYHYSIQYPAIFTGHIDFSFLGQPKNGKPTYKKLQFHIMG